MTTDTQQSTSQPENAGIYAARTWPQDWKRDGFNGCITTGINALQYLSEHERPYGGSDVFNSEHLYDTARDLKNVRDDLVAFYESDFFHPSEALNWPREWLNNGYKGCLPEVVEALQYLASHPRKTEGSQFTREHLLALAHDLRVTHKSLFDVPAQDTSITRPETKAERISASNLPEGFIIRDPVAYAYAKEFERAGGGIGGAANTTGGNPGVQGAYANAGGGAGGLATPPVEASDFVPGTMAGFVGGFMALNRREPTRQEVFDAGVRAGQKTAAAASFRQERTRTASELGPEEVDRYNQAIDDAANNARQQGNAQAADDILSLLLPRKR